ncbi:adrenodoxin [Salmo salar]|uniref:Adrenodoxin, mitochondrial n=1 Tax=Salmo salar TaxID=8030 RepID=B5X5K3_SALSA|nr:adrenodoxin [Salmo salar]ACI66123.1 Adrenodoxin, mitochondrial precursor [Salmo salar]ACN11152.1 Adrenodoxin, mitochondrial precursor [Salmo salar]|eukprot:XP_014007533.1 PREDICTED: adrenodoxin-like [Salmo salar]
MALMTSVRRLFHVSFRENSLRRTEALISATNTTSGSLSLAGQRMASIRVRDFSTNTQPLRADNKVTVHFINRDGEKISVKGSPGDSLLDVIIDQDLDFDGFGACEGTLACSTCHLIFEEDVYNQLGPITDEEMDMLDLAYGLTDTSRLGCQICLTRSLEGMTARVPESVADIRQSGDGSS